MLPGVKYLTNAYTEECRMWEITVPWPTSFGCMINLVASPNTVQCNPIMGTAKTRTPNLRKPGRLSVLVLKGRWGVDLSSNL